MRGRPRGASRVFAALVALTLTACSMGPMSRSPAGTPSEKTIAWHSLTARPPRIPSTPASRSRTQPALDVDAGSIGHWPKTRVVEIIRQAAIRYGIDVERFLEVARCESGFNPRAVGGEGLYAGLFQQAVTYWPSRARDAGYAGTSVFDPVANANVSAYLVVHGGWGHWPSCAF